CDDRKAGGRAVRALARPAKAAGTHAAPDVSDGPRRASLPLGGEGPRRDQSRVGSDDSGRRARRGHLVAVSGRIRDPERGQGRVQPGSRRSGHRDAGAPQVRSACWRARQDGGPAVRGGAKSADTAGPEALQAARRGRRDRDDRGPTIRAGTIHEGSVVKALCWYGRGIVSVEVVPDPEIINPHDAIVRVTKAAICGSDLHLFDGKVPTMQKGDILGHEPVGAGVELGSAVTNLAVGDRVVVPFPISCGECWYCRNDLWSLCDNTRAGRSACRASSAAWPTRSPWALRSTRASSGRWARRTSTATCGRYSGRS